MIVQIPTLQEDTYTSALSDIIARDFFPSLAHLDATNGYLSALESKDPEQISKSVRRLEGLATPTPGRYHNQQTPSHTPYATGPSDTPMSTRSAIESLGGKSITEGVSLDQFQARYTSEDNASFATIIQDENNQRKEKWAWAWDAQRKVEDRKTIEAACRETALIEAGKATLAITAAGEPDTTNTNNRPAKELSGDSSGRGLEVVLSSQGDSAGENQLVKVDQSPIMADIMAPQNDTRPAGVPAWKFKVWCIHCIPDEWQCLTLLKKARNSLMFPPDADQSPYDNISSVPVPVPAKGGLRSIHYGGTRIVEREEASGVTEPSSPTHSRVDAAIAGRPCESLQWT